MGDIVNPMDNGPLGMFGFIADNMLGEPHFRKDALTEEVGGLTVDTVCPSDTNRWETGVLKKGTWIIVEQYSSEEEAKAGHDAWVTKIEADPDTPLRDVFYADYGIDDDPWDEVDEYDD